MTLEEINNAIDEAYDAALVDAVAVPAVEIADGVWLRTEVYDVEEEEAAGFYVMCSVVLLGGNLTVTRVRNHGPADGLERDWPVGGLEAATAAHVARCIACGEAWVKSQGFSADRKVILLSLLLEAKEAEELAARPKLMALHAWMRGVQDAAVAGVLGWAAAPYGFEEVLAE